MINVINLIIQNFSKFFNYFIYQMMKRQKKTQNSYFHNKKYSQEPEINTLRLTVSHSVAHSCWCFQSEIILFLQTEINYQSDCNNHDDDYDDENEHLFPVLWLEFSNNKRNANQLTNEILNLQRIYLLEQVEHLPIPRSHLFVRHSSLCYLFKIDIAKSGNARK